MMDKESIFPSKEQARKTETLTSEQLRGLNEVEIAVLLYYLIANSGQGIQQIKIISSLLEGTAMQAHKL